jgi:hypothetical protein
MTEYSERIIRILEPKTGHALARSVLLKTCVKRGIAPENITPDTLPAIADGLYEPLRIFGGDAFAQTLTSQIKAIAL